MLKKLVNKYVQERLDKEIALVNTELGLHAMKTRIHEKAQREELARHNKLVEGWLAAVMKAQGIEPPVEVQE